MAIVDVGDGCSKLLLMSPRQQEILLLAAAGQSDKEIAQTLALSVPTVRTHLTRLYRRNQLRNRAEAASIWSATNVAKEHLP
jgi:DNA-binding CsgD family transcriptional regulator